MRKAQFSWISAMILMMLVIISILAFYGDVAAKFRSNDEKMACKTSVLEHAAAHLKIIDLSSDVKCPTRDISVDGDEEKMKSQLATAMYDCWDQFGEGKLDIFGPDGIYCAVCNRVDFGSKGELTGFGNYLAFTSIPGKDISYLDYLNGYDTKKAQEAFSKTKMDPAWDKPIDMSKKYSVIFVYAKGGDYVTRVFDAATKSYSIYSLGAGVVVLLTGIATGGTGFLVWGGIITVLGGSATYVETGITMERPDHAAFIVLREYTEDQLKQLGCQTLPVSQKQ